MAQTPGLAVPLAAAPVGISSPAATTPAVTTVTPPAGYDVGDVAAVLGQALAVIFPAAAPVILASGAALEKLVPWLVLVIQGQKVTLTQLREMQVELNQLGPSFPSAGGYSNAFAGGTSPAPGTTPSQASPNSATIVVNGGSVTIQAETLEALLGIITLLLKKP